MKRKRLYPWALFLILAWTLSASALQVPERPDGRVTDHSGTLTQSQITALENKLAAFEKETTNQIVVVLLPSLEGASLEDYSIRLAEKWQVGQKGKNNGVILLVFKNDRRIRIEVGYGLEGALPDALAGTVIRQEIAPLFKAGRFYEGLQAGVEAIMAATQGEYRASQKKESDFPEGSLWIFLVFLFLLVGFFLLHSKNRRRHYSTGSSRGWTAGGGILGGGSSWGDAGGRFSGGGGDFGGGGASGEW